MSPAGQGGMKGRNKSVNSLSPFSQWSRFVFLSYVTQIFQAVSREVWAPWTWPGQPWVMELLWLLCDSQNQWGLCTGDWGSGAVVAAAQEAGEAWQIQMGSYAGLGGDVTLIINRLSWLHITDNPFTTNLNFNFTVF